MSHTRIGDKGEPFSWDARVKKAHDIIDEAIEKYKPLAVYGLFTQV